MGCSDRRANVGCGRQDAIHDRRAAHSFVGGRSLGKMKDGTTLTARQERLELRRPMKLGALRALYEESFFDLIQQARNLFLEHWNGRQVQLCTLLSIKTGGCSEDCAYCAQSARYQTAVENRRLMPTDDVLDVARRAKEQGSTRFCMGAAWKGVRDGDPRFSEVLRTISAVSKLGMEVCVTLGHLGVAEARQLKEAGVTAYNH